MRFRLAVFVFVLCADGYGQDNSIRPASRYGQFARTSGMTAPIYTPDCSATSQTPPSAADASTEDYVELERSMCFGACPAYRVRLYRTGEIEWLPGQQTLPQVVFDTTADPAEATALLDRVYEQEFWSACESYPVAEDAPTYDLRLNIAGRHKAIEFGDTNDLEWLEAYTSDLDRMVDTHRRLHGDPATEPLYYMSTDVALSKRSLTPLMRAAARDDLEKVALLLAGGAPVDEQDASGWTALMYAGGTYEGKAVSALLKAGANPNHMDFAGRTPLMASAHGLAYEEILIAMRNANGQNQSGLTALMLVAKSANAEGIRRTLANGADPALADASGQTAWDFLMQSDCGRVLQPENLSRLPEPSAESREQCIELDRLLKPPVR